MGDDIRLAFAHPVERAKVENGPLPDRISLRDYITSVEIGAFQGERDLTQRLRFNVVVEVRGASDHDDDVDQILSYDKVSEAIEAELTNERLNLLETLAERVAARILGEPQALRIFVRIEKLDRGSGDLGVEIARSRGDVAPARVVTAPRPVILFLSEEVLQSPYLTAWIDRAVADERPVIICVSPLPAVQSPDPAAQRRIDLLAIEQNAWALAARDPRCVVVETRTELDWGLHHNQISVWAPSKLVLNEVEGGIDDPKNIPKLLTWFGKQMQADRIIWVGEPDFQTSGIIHKALMDIDL